MSTLRTWTRIWRIVSQSSSPGVARATAARKAAATTARSASWSRVKSALRCRLVMSVEPDPGLRHLHARLALQDVEQDEHALAGGDAALDQAADPRRARDPVEVRPLGAHEDVAGEERPHVRADRRPGPSPQQREIGLQPLLRQAHPRHRLAVAARRDGAPGLRLGVSVGPHGSARRTWKLSAP